MTRQAAKHGKKVSHPVQLPIPEKIESQETDLSQKITLWLYFLERLFEQLSGGQIRRIEQPEAGEAN